MYLTWEPSEQGEKTWIAHKYKKVSLLPGSTIISPIQQPPPLDLDAPSSRNQNLIVKVAQNEPPPK